MNQKRKSSNFGASSDKRQKTSSDTSEIIESEESEASPENFAGETKETDSDRRGREKKEREQKKREDKAERERQRVAKRQQVNLNRVLRTLAVNEWRRMVLSTFEGGTDFGPFSSRPIAEEATVF